MNTTTTALEFIISLKWLWIIVVLYGISLMQNVIIILNERNRINDEKNKLERDKFIKEFDIEERKKIVNSLDELITEILAEYVMLQVKAKDIDYINTDLENKIRNFITEELPKRMPTVLLKKLEFAYNEEYVGTLIGARIFFAVTDYRLSTNVAKEDKSTD